MSITREQISTVLKNEFAKQEAIVDEQQKDQKYKYSLDENEFVDNFQYYENKQIGDLTFTCVNQEGGEDQGSYYHIILQVTNSSGDSLLMKIEGHYSSYDATEFYNQLERFKIVEEYERIVKDYREVK